MVTVVSMADRRAYEVVVCRGADVLNQPERDRRAGAAAVVAVELKAKQTTARLDGRVTCRWPTSKRARDPKSTFQLGMQYLYTSIKYIITNTHNAYVL